MLPKTNRIKKKKDFEMVFSKSRSSKNKLFVLKIGKNDLGESRFGFMVSKKISKKATVRNKIRRRLAEAAKAEIKNIKTGTDLVFIALPGIEKSELSEIREVLRGALLKEKITVQG